MMLKKHLHKLGAVAVLVVFIAAVLVVRRAFAATDFSSLLRNLPHFPLAHIFAALLLTGLTYLSLTAYDFLALRYIRRPLSCVKTFLTSFAAYTMSANLGMSFFAGNSVRYRLYSGWGLAAGDVAKIAGFCSFSSILGFLTFAGLALILHPAILFAAAPISLVLIRPFGAFLLSLPLGYLLLSLFRKRPLKIFRWRLPLPPIKIAAGQFIFSLLNWSMASAALYALLPAIPGLTFLKFLGIFIISQEAGLLSQIPGGLGVFDSAIIFFLSPVAPGSVVLQSLVVYRAIYYLLPLCAGISIIGGQELLRKREQLEWLIQAVSGKFSSARLFLTARWATADIPILGAIRRLADSALAIGKDGFDASRFAYGALMIAFGGILLFLGAIPTLEGPLGWLRNILPLPVLGLSHILFGIGGMAIIFICLEFKRRIDAAYLVTLVLLLSGIAFSLFSGHYYLRTIPLSLMLTVILPSRRHFHKQTLFFGRRFAFGHAFALLAILVCAFL